MLTTRASPRHRQAQLVILDSTVAGDPGIAGDGIVYARNVRNQAGAVLKGQGAEVREALRQSVAEYRPASAPVEQGG